MWRMRLRENVLVVFFRVVERMGARVMRVDDLGRNNLYDFSVLRSKLLVK